MVWRAAITATITINCWRFASKHVPWNFCFGQVCQLQFSKKTFFPKFKLPNSGCGLSISAAYRRVFTVLRVSSWNLRLILSCPTKEYWQKFLYTQWLREFLFTLKLSWILRKRSDMFWLHACTDVFLLCPSTVHRWFVKLYLLMQSYHLLMHLTLCLWRVELVCGETVD
jgi:hypothetical protein